MIKAKNGDYQTYLQEKLTNGVSELLFFRLKEISA